MSKQKIDPDAGGPWDVGMERVPLVRLEGNEVHIENFRNFRYECNGGHDDGSQAKRVRRSIPTITVDFSDDKLKSVCFATG